MLLEEKWDDGGLALIAEIARPVWVHRSGVVAGFAANDDPVDAVQARLTGHICPEPVR